MRIAFHEQLDATFGDLAEISALVATAVHDAAAALLTGDAAMAERVIDGDAAIDAARERVEDSCFSLLSLQQPVAGDLRTIVAALRIVTVLERMGDLSVHVAKIARMRVPNRAVPAEAEDTITEMADLAERMVRKTTRVLADKDVDVAASLADDDEQMDRLRRANFTELLADDWPHGVASAVDIALLGRYFERIADHACGVAERVVFVVTGEHAEIR